MNDAQAFGELARASPNGQTFDRAHQGTVDEDQVFRLRWSSTRTSLNVTDSRGADLSATRSPTMRPHRWVPSRA